MMTNNLTTFDDDDGPSDWFGALLKFNSGKWYVDGVELPVGTQLLVHDAGSFLQRWENGKPIEKITARPLPDIDQLNNQIPKSQWDEDLNGQPRAPWAKTFYVRFFNEATFEQLRYLASSTGARIAVTELREAVLAVRRVHPNACPIVEPSAKPMPTRFGSKVPRPWLKIVGWRGLGEAEAPALLPSGPTTKAA